MNALVPQVAVRCGLAGEEVVGDFPPAPLPVSMRKMVKAAQTKQGRFTVFVRGLLPESLLENVTGYVWGQTHSQSLRW